MSSTLKKYFKHYVWAIVSIGVFIQMIGSALRNIFGILVDPLNVNFNWSVGEIGIAYALMSITSALSSPFCGWLGDRFGAKRTMFFGSLLFLFGMLWVSFMNNLWEFYIAYGLVLGFSQSLLGVPIVPAVISWFRRHVGLGTGALMVSWSLGPALTIQILAISFVNYGWRNTFWFIGIFVSIITFILLIFFKDSPEKAGKKPFGWLEKDEDSINSLKSFDLSNQNLIYRTDAFWHLVNIHFWGCVGHAIILVCIIPLAINKGIGPIQAAGVLSTIATISILSRFFFPIIGDKFGSRFIIFISFLGQGLSVLILLFTDSILGFYVFAVSFGLPYGGEGTVHPVINRQYFGRFPMGRTYGWQLFGAGLGMALGGIIPGLVFDLSNSYDIAIIISCISSLIGAFIIIILPKTNKELINWNESLEQT
tara:strand:- start:254 stop:1522 length:1269 start_codon:yes stop_codon:yes gene_type:complete